ncbi:MAG: hypothetical protein HY886_08260 [Deltaproteobacteria bacterium]|nr:hypothetical protein [Deltaproteobacteria bacterium]
MIVFDSSTLILLAKIDVLELFISDYGGQVVIPEKVREEVLMKDGDETPGLYALIKDARIGVLRASDGKLPQKLMDDFNIDSGEAEAIAAALKKRATVATDDRNAIRACKFLKIDFITAIAILIRAVEKGLIDKSEAIFKLEKLADVGRYKKTIIVDARRHIKGGIPDVSENS